jgi:glycosyltransferase involved in cell wall biosynthesis
MDSAPWVSFCISTFKRPVILRKQLKLLLSQTFEHFEIVVSDNDPEASARIVAEEMNDSRLRYFHNTENLGMIKSFNKSIERARTEFIVMVTDDDPVEQNFLETMYKIHTTYPGFSLYGGFLRKDKKQGELEIISSENFCIELLDPDKTINLLWSSTVIKRLDALSSGLIPDYGSPHLADHAFLAVVGSQNGAIILNKMFSTLSSHDSNFSKFNFQYYVKGCSGFYKFMNEFACSMKNENEIHKVILKHLGCWFITNFFSLKKYFSITKKEPLTIDSINKCAREILELSFMKRFRFRFFLKNFIFLVKKHTGLLGYQNNGF